MVNNFRDIILETRRMKEALRLRESEPEEVEKIINEMIKKAIVLQDSGSAKFANIAQDELKQTLKDMIAGQIDAGNAQTLMIGKISNVLETMDEVEQEVKKRKSDEQISTIKDSISNNVPSMDTITGAIMTANPIMGYGMKMMNDFFGSRKEKKRREEEERRFVSRQKLKEKKIIDDEEEAIQEKNEYVERYYTDESNSLSLIPYLERIIDNLEKFNEAFGVEVERKQESEEDSAESVERVNESVDNQTESINQTNEHVERVAENTDNKESIESKFESGSDTNIAAGAFDSKKGGKRGGILGAITGMLSGLFTPIIAFFKPLIDMIKKVGTKLKTFIKGIGGALSKLKGLGKLTGIGTVILGIIDFFDGLFNAHKIIENFEGDWMDRIGVALTHVVTGIVTALTGLVDWITDSLFDFKIFDWDHDEATQGVVKFVDSIHNFFSRAINYLFSIDDKIANAASSFGNWIKEGFNNIVDWFVDGIKSGLNAFFSLPTTILGWFKEGLVQAFELMPQWFKDTVGSVFEEITNLINEYIMPVVNWVKDKLSWISDSAGAAGDWVSEKVTSVKEFFFGEEQKQFDMSNRDKQGFPIGTTDKEKSNYIFENNGTPLEVAQRENQEIIYPDSKEKEEGGWFSNLFGSNDNNSEVVNEQTNNSEVVKESSMPMTRTQKRQRDRLERIAFSNDDSDRQEEYFAGAKNDYYIMNDRDAQGFPNDWSKQDKSRWIEQNDGVTPYEKFVVNGDREAVITRYNQDTYQLDKIPVEVRGGKIVTVNGDAKNSTSVQTNTSVSNDSTSQSEQNITSVSNDSTSQSDVSMDRGNNSYSKDFEFSQNIDNQNTNDLIEQKQNSGRSASGNVVVAPSSNQTNVNNTIYNGAKIAENSEPTFRRLTRLNHAFEH